MTFAELTALAARSAFFTAPLAMSSLRTELLPERAIAELESAANSAIHAITNAGVGLRSLNTMTSLSGEATLRPAQSQSNRRRLSTAPAVSRPGWSGPTLGVEEIPPTATARRLRGPFAWREIPPSVRPFRRPACRGRGARFLLGGRCRDRAHAWWRERESVRPESGAPPAAVPAIPRMRHQPGQPSRGTL